jgi:outer membrane protein assembly factor BamB
MLVPPYIGGVCALVAMAAVVPQLPAWPQFGGPAGDFTLPGRPLAVESSDGPVVRWSRDLGEGFSGIAVDGDSLFSMYRRGDEELIVALEAATGRTRWEHGMAAPAHKDQDFSQGPGPHATPLVAGGVVCGAGATARLRCLDEATGRLLWSRDLVAEFGATVVYRGYSSSPVAHDEAVIVQAGGKGQAVLAFDRRTGKSLWKSGDHANTNSSPALLDLGGKRQLVAFMADVVAGFDPDTGAVLWSHPHPQRFKDNIVKPLRVGDDTIVITSALDGGTRALRISRRDGAWQADERWHQARAGAYYTNAVAAGGLVVLSSGGVGPTLFTGIRLDTGAIVWQSREIVRSQILAVGDRLLLRDETGGLALATADASGVRVLTRATVLAEGAPSPPTLVGTTLYARDRARIVSIDLAPRAK